MTAIGLGALAALVLASLGMYVAFSYVAAGFILAVVASAVIEQGDSEASISPYAGMLGFLGLVFVAGLTGIWLLWSPGVAEYDYVLGVPASTFVYFGFIWLLPLLAAIYYSVAFDRIAGDEIVDDIVEDAHVRQRQERFPLEPETGPVADVGSEADAGAETEATDD